MFDCITIDINRGLPEPHVVVIVAGGLAVWTGSVWLSKTDESNNCVITWPVKWWTPLIYDEDVELK